MKFLNYTTENRIGVICILFSILICAYTQTFPQSSSTFLYLLVLFFGLSGSVQLVNHGYKSRYTYSFILLSFYIIVVGLCWGFDFSGARGERSLYLSLDLRYLLLFFMGTVFASNDESMSIYHSFMRIIAFFSILCGIAGLLTFDLSLINSRGNAWNTSYYMWWMSTTCFSYCGYYALFVKKEKLLFGGAFAAYIILGLLFLKRSAFINLIVIFFVYSLLNRENKLGSILGGFFIFCVVSVGLYIISPDYFVIVKEALFSRFEAVADQNELDRNVELAAYWSITSPFEIILGRGAGNYLDLPDWGNFTAADLIGSLHIGWANIIYKGGILYAVYYIFLYINIFRNRFSKDKLSPYAKVCYGVAISSLISLLYEGSWTHTLLPFCMSAPIFYIATYSSNCSQIEDFQNT